MATISSAGIGSGLDVKSIVSQLVALEKAPLKNLQLEATRDQDQISAMGQIQSQFSALSTVSTTLATAGSWSARKTSSSNSGAATISATSTTGATTFTLDVDALAAQQSVASPRMGSQGSQVGSGTLVLRLGTWSGSGAATAFAPTSSSADVSISVTASDTVTTVAASINAAKAGVVATVFNDGTQDRLLLRSTNTGVAAGFRLQATPTTADPGGIDLSRLSFDPAGGDVLGMAGQTIQFGQDAAARINGLAVTSGSNTLTGNIPGVTVNLLATTTTGYGTASEVKSPLTMVVSEDVTPAVKNVSDFVTAYNTLAKSLSDLTKYDSGTKTSSLFQGDSAVLGLQSVLRSMLGSTSAGSAYSRLSDVGIEMQRDGTLSLNTTKLSTAANNGTELQKFFALDNRNVATNGFGVKMRDFASGVLASGGQVSNKATALQNALKRNATEQTRVNDKAAIVEARLNKQYSALDAKMASLSALNSYVAQQVTTWNKSTA
jgi:flagellar hook-associated protein 2